MGVNLTKGQKVSLTKGNPGLSKVGVGLGWGVNKFDTGTDFDLDASAFLVDQSGRVTRQEDFIFYGNMTHPSGAVKYMGDNRSGEGEGDDETIKVDLLLVPENILKIIFTVTIYDAETRRQNFGQVENAFIRVYDDKNGDEREEQVVLPVVAHRGLHPVGEHERGKPRRAGLGRARGRPRRVYDSRADGRRIGRGVGRGGSGRKHDCGHWRRNKRNRRDFLGWYSVQQIHTDCR